MEDSAAAFDEDVPGFPGCKHCRYRQTGPTYQCVTCAHRTLSSPGARSCQICHQALTEGALCRNRLCREPWRREFTRMRAIAVKERGGPLEGRIQAHKYQSPTYPGPPNRRFQHTEAVIDSAAVQDVRGVWPFDQETPRAIVVTGQRPQSAGGTLADKLVSAEEPSRFLLVPDPARVEGRRVVVYDDVMTTGETSNVIARALRHAGALEVSGIVLARQPW